MTAEICGDNRFKLIEKYKQELIESTNIESSPGEMAELDNFMFRVWQMRWLDAAEKEQRRKPIYEALDGGDEYWYCPNCGEVVMAKLQESPILNEYNHNHCGGCGQAIDWRTKDE